MREGKLLLEPVGVGEEEDILSSRVINDLEMLLQMFCQLRRFLLRSLRIVRLRERG